MDDWVASVVRHNEEGKRDSSRCKDKSKQESGHRSKQLDTGGLEDGDACKDSHCKSKKDADSRPTGKTAKAKKRKMKDKTKRKRGS